MLQSTIAPIKWWTLRNVIPNIKIIPAMNINFHQYHLVNFHLVNLRNSSLSKNPLLSVSIARNAAAALSIFTFFLTNHQWLLLITIMITTMTQITKAHLGSLSVPRMLAECSQTVPRQFPEFFFFLSLYFYNSENGGGKVVVKTNACKVVWIGLYLSFLWYIHCCILYTCQQLFTDHLHKSAFRPLSQVWEHFWWLGMYYVVCTANFYDLSKIVHRPLSQVWEHFLMTWHVLEVV